MILSIGTQFSREFTFEDGNIAKDLETQLNSILKRSNYGDRIEKIYIGIKIFLCFTNQDL